MSDARDNALPRLLQQYEHLAQVRMQIEYCLESIGNKSELTIRLNELNNLILPMDKLFSETSRISSIFSTKTTLPHEIEEIINEAKKIIKEAEEILALKRLNQRTP